MTEFILSTQIICRKLVYHHQSQIKIIDHMKAIISKQIQLTNKIWVTLIKTHKRIENPVLSLKKVLFVKIVNG